VGQLCKKMTYFMENMENLNFKNLDFTGFLKLKKSENTDISLLSRGSRVRITPGAPEFSRV